MRSLKQKSRIAFEEQLVTKYFPGARLYDLLGITLIVYWISVSGYRYNYRLKVELPADYPEAKPDLYIESPGVLPMFGSFQTINDLKTSHAYHVYNNRPDSRVKICFAFDWDASANCIVVLTRAMIWIAGYEHHLRTGETIAEYIDTFKDRLNSRQRGTNRTNLVWPQRYPSPTILQAGVIPEVERYFLHM